MKLHTELAWMGYGSIFTKEASTAFTTLLEKVPMKQGDVDQCEMFFTLWRNEFPVKLINTVKPHQYDDIPDTNVISQESFEESMNRHVGTLFTDLSKNGVLFPKGEINPPTSKRSVRSACHNDKCMFITDLDAFPMQQNFGFTLKPSLKSHFKKFTNDNFPPRDYVMKYGFQNAVDKDDYTCWNSQVKPISGSYFGLDLLEQATWDKIYFKLGQYTTLEQFELFYVVENHYNTENWKPISFDLLQAKNTNFIQLSPPEEFRWIIFKVKEESNAPIEVCSLFIV
jgi:hypothetical protein